MAGQHIPGYWPAANWLGEMARSGGWSGREPFDGALVTGWPPGIDKWPNTRPVSGANDCYQRREGSGGMVGHENAHRLGWLGTGRMGVEMARRLLEAGCDLAVYNRSSTKGETLGGP